MKKITLILLLLYIHKHVCSQIPNINFNESSSWEEIKKTAQLENKLIFVDLYATWCAPCKRMENEVYNTSTVAQYVNSNYIPIKLQIDTTSFDTEDTRKKKALAKYLVQTFKITSFPTYLFFSNDGQMIHRDKGFLQPEYFLALCKLAKDTLNNDIGEIKKLTNNTMEKKELVNFAIKMKSFNEDSLSKIAMLRYKEIAIDKENPRDLITEDLIKIIDRFPNLLNSKDNIIKYIFEHKQEVDNKLNQKGIADNIVDFFATKEIITPSTELCTTTIQNRPSWDSLEKNVKKKWGSETANRTILLSKIKWYTRNQEWDSVIKYRFKQIDLKDSIGLFDSYEINNFVWEVVFKYSNDSNVIKRACKYMKNITSKFPENYSAIDTYANILYKSGQRKQAILTEKKAVAMAEKSNNKSELESFLQTIKKMEENVATW